MFARTGRVFLCGVVALALIGPAAVAAADGKAVFTAQKCNMCHSVAQAELTATMKSEKMKGPDLPAESHDSKWLVSYLKREVQLNDKDHKKEFKGTDEEAQAIAAWLVELKGSK